MNKCVVCQSQDNRPLYSGILRCARCGHAFADLRPSDQQLSEIYGQKYFCGYEYNDYLREGRVLQKNFKLRLKVLEKFIDSAQHKRLLEIGCAYGFFLDLVRGKFSRALGIDISSEAIAYAQKELRLNALKANFLNYDFSGEKFDLICLWDTIEHLRDPHLYLEKINSHARSGSLVAITTGDIDSLNARMRKGRWRLIHYPTHLHYFSRNSLGKLLDNCGFEIIYNRYCGFYRSLEAMAYRALLSSQNRSFYCGWLRRSGLAGLTLYLNLYDIMYIIAKKR